MTLSHDDYLASVWNNESPTPYDAEETTQTRMPTRYEVSEIVRDALVNEELGLWSNLVRAIWLGS